MGAADRKWLTCSYCKDAGALSTCENAAENAAKPELSHTFSAIGGQFRTLYGRIDQMDGSNSTDLLAKSRWYGNGLGKLFQTIDGGATWVQRAHLPGTFIRAFEFVDEKIGFMGNVGTQYYPDVSDTHPLYRTGDGGSTWTKVNAEGIDKVKGICEIHLLPQQRIYQCS